VRIPDSATRRGRYTGGKAFVYQTDIFPNNIWANIERSLTNESLKTSLSRGKVLIVRPSKSTIGHFFGWSSRSNRGFDVGTKLQQEGVDPTRLVRLKPVMHFIIWV